MLKHTLFALLISFTACRGQTPEKTTEQTSKDPVAALQAKEKESMEKGYDSLGEPVANIPFRVTTTNTKDFKDGIIPWASLEKPEQDIPDLVDKDEVVIKETVVKIIIDYPVDHPYEFTIRSDKGFTRQQMLTEISKHYYEMYSEEESTATVKTIPPAKRTTMYNRNQTNGKYGIWGHDIADLVLSGVSVYRTKQGEIVVVPGIES